ncbi:MAG: hypothetical protein ACRC5Q_00690 [Culicoidibacterales bacterium]
MVQTARESLKITLGLALVVVIFTKFDRNMLTFVLLFVLMELVYLGLTAIIARVKDRKLKRQ